MGNKKRVMKNNEILKISIIFVIIIGFIFVFNIVSKKPSIVGKVVLGEEAVHSENLNLEVNESGAYEWQVKNPGDIKSLKATGSVSANGTARVYIEKEGERKLLFDSTRQLFDVDIHVLPEYKKIFQGDKVLIQNALFNLRGFGSGDVNVRYSIRDSKGNLIASEEETIFVETQAKFVRELVMPPEIKAGAYVAFVEASTNGTIVGSGSDTFEVKAKYEYVYPQGLKYYIIGIAVIVGIFIILILVIYGFNILRKKKKIAELKKKAPEERVAQLRKELKALEDARKAGLLSEGSYKRESSRIKKELESIKK